MPRTRCDKKRIDFISSQATKLCEALDRKKFYLQGALTPAHRKKEVLQPQHLFAPFFGLFYLVGGYIFHVFRQMGVVLHELRIQTALVGGEGEVTQGDAHVDHLHV